MSLFERKVNTIQSKIFFLKNIDHNKAKEIANAMGFTTVLDLGKYLGIPIYHKRVLKESINSFLKKFSTK